MKWHPKLHYFSQLAVVGGELYVVSDVWSAVNNKSGWGNGINGKRSINF